MRADLRISAEQKPLATPGETPWSRLDHAFRTILTVPKQRLLKEEAKDKRQRKRKRSKKTA